jgi:hypothetical protein
MGDSAGFAVSRKGDRTGSRHLYGSGGPLTALSPLRRIARTMGVGCRGRIIMTAAVNVVIQPILLVLAQYVLPPWRWSWEELPTGASCVLPRLGLARDGQCGCAYII